jgi:hypothetical protein
VYEEVTERMFNTPFGEGVKETGRWLLLFLVSWIITETLNQANLIPESATLKVWVFSYVIPIRTAVVFALTLVGRFADKWIHEIGKATDNLKMMGGLTRF